MKKTYTKFTAAIARFARWVVIGILSFLVAAPIIVSFNA